MSDLNEVIEDAISDAEIPAEPVEETPVETEAIEAAPVEETPETPVEDAPTTDEVPSPAAQTEKDEFEKKFGIPGMSASGRENRIPYSRVKKISEKAAADAVAAKVKEFEPQLAERDTKIQDYEGRLQKVAEFEEVMVNDPDQFLGMLAQLPVYKPFFDKLNTVAGPVPQDTPPSNTPVADDMPVPDQQLSDGTMVYSMDGLKALNTWNRAQARAETLVEVDKKFGPMAKAWNEHQSAKDRMDAIIPQVQQQITDARTWPLFNEHETEIVKALQDNQKLSLEGAYRQVVYPKLVADRGKMREEILKEVQKAPRATAVTAPASKSTAQVTPTGPRALEDVIGDAIKTLK